MKICQKHTISYTSDLLSDLLFDLLEFSGVLRASSWIRATNEWGEHCDIKGGALPYK